MIDTVIDVVLLIFLVVMAWTVIGVRHLLGMVMLLSLYSLLCAGLFLVLDAPDVAFTEAAVGSGISTALMLLTLVQTRVPYEKRRPNRAWLPLLVALITGAALIYGTQDIAAMGEAQAPAHSVVADRYIHESKQETGLPNMVTAVLASYRGFDTLGEVTVIFTAGLGVLLLLWRRREAGADGDGDER